MDLNFTVATKRDIYRRQLEKELAELVDPKTNRLKSEISEYVACPLCGEDDEHTELFVVKGYPHVRCKKCGLVFVNPQVKEEKLHELYENSKANDLWLDVLMSSTESKARYELYERYFEELEKNTAHRTLMDVGCSIGDLLVVAKRRSWRAQGFDLSKKAVDFARNTRGLNVHLGKLEDFGFKANSLPVITLTGVLEHLNRPREILYRIRNLLSADGVILVQVPNLQSLHNMVLHEKSTSFDGRNHLIFFNPTTLRKMLSSAGYEVKYIRTYQAVTHLVCRYLQYYDPYQGGADFSFLPAKVRSWLEDGTKHNQLIQWLEEMDMGRCIMAIAAKQKNREAKT
ncbi:MAG: methyltransferase domain-containing protein [Candidatus Omnitrophota bacterium]|nr:MAG: methyltransferase domain-containing protein [Candidatus Omnitrophota bacterium]